MPVHITYSRTGQTRVIEPGCSLLMAFKLHGIEVAYSCENATCGTCVVRVDAGLDLLTPMDEIEHRLLLALGYDGQSDPRYRLACQAQLKASGKLAVFNKVP